MARTKRESYEKALESVVSRLDRIEAGSRLPLLSTAKAIERALNERVKIVFSPTAGNTLGDMGPAMTATQQLQLCRPGSEVPSLILEHFIFWATDLRPVQERFVIAHELGHIYLHHRAFLLQDKKQRYVPLPLGGDRSAFAVQFTPRQEMEADLFAAVLVQQRPAPSVRPRLLKPCPWLVRQLADKGWLHCRVADITPCGTFECALAEDLTEEAPQSVGS